MTDVTLPTLSLHSLHASEDSFAALSAEAISSIFVASDALGASKPSGQEEEPDAPNERSLTSRVAVTVNGPQLVIGPLSGQVVKIPVLFSEVCHGSDCRTGKPLLALCARSSASHWLISVHGDYNAVNCTLATLGAKGAIRLDFASTFDVEREPIGEGSNATVYAASKRHEVPGNLQVCVVEPGTFAVKMAHPGATVEDDLRFPKDVETEVIMLSAVQEHPNILRFCGLFCGTTEGDEDEVLNPRWALVMERYSEGDLFDAVLRSRFSDTQARSVVLGIFQALVHIHGRGIVHRDVKPENVLLGKNREAILSDFGISCRLSDAKEMLRQCGSPGYAAPELLSGRPYGAKVDTFSTGCLLFFLLSAQVPFEGGSLAQTLARTVRCVVDFNCSSTFKSVSNTCKNFMLIVLTKLEEDRPDAEEALSDQWLLGNTSETRRDRSPGGLSIGKESGSSHLLGEPKTPRSSRSKHNHSPWAEQQQQQQLEQGNPRRSRRYRLKTGEGALDRCMQEAQTKSSKGHAGSGGEDSALMVSRRDRRLQSWNGAAGASSVARMKNTIGGVEANDRVSTACAAAYAGIGRIAPGDAQQQQVPRGRRRRSSVAGVGGLVEVAHRPVYTPVADIPEHKPQNKRRSSDAGSLRAAAAAAASASQQRASMPTTPRQKPGPGKLQPQLSFDMSPMSPASARSGTPRLSTPAGTLRPMRQEHRNISWAGTARDVEMNTPTPRRSAKVAAAKTGRSTDLVPPPQREMHRSSTTPSQSPSRSEIRPSSGARNGSPRPGSPRNGNNYQEVTVAARERLRVLHPLQGPTKVVTNESVELGRKSQVSKEQIVPQPPDALEAEANLAHPDGPPKPLPLAGTC